VPSAVRTKIGNSREQREDNTKESKFISKEVLESKTHEEVPDYEDGGCSVWKTTVTEPIVHVEEEEPEATNMRLSVVIYCAESDSKEEDESQSKKHGPCPPSSCSNQSRGALAFENSHTKCEEGESDPHHERSDLHQLMVSDPYHQRE
jgi:hypothetical protein